MIDDDDGLRESINGAPARETVRRSRRHRRKSFKPLGRRLIAPIAIMGLVLAGGTLFWPDTAVHAIHQSNGQVVAINPVALSPEVPVLRAPAPQAPTPLFNQRLAALDPNGDAPPVPGQPGVGGQNVGRTGLSGAITDADTLVAETNTVLATVLGSLDLTYQPLDWAEPAAWAESACSARSLPGEAAYCIHDARLYVEQSLPEEPEALLDLAHEIGQHMHSQFGLLLPPLDPVTTYVQVDCLAGYWARQNIEWRFRLNPETLSRALNPGDEISPIATRIAAFRQGYLGGGPLACRDIDLASL